ncbi:hypothetical protein MPER_11202 [Moniliophthora perniciosa FA553]|nr:hypothetical protein MPER_11202 [Moniliophthora perniciosa FA553]
MTSTQGEANLVSFAGLVSWFRGIRNGYKPHVYFELSEFDLYGTVQDAAEIIFIIGDRNTPYADNFGDRTIGPGWPSTPGVLISTSRSLRSETNLAAVGPGQKSGEQVYKALELYDGHGLVSAAPRSGEGIRIGLGCWVDTVIGFEVALSTGKVMKATHTSNVDLFLRLKINAASGLGEPSGNINIANDTHSYHRVVSASITVKLNVTLLLVTSQGTNADPNAVVGVTPGGLFISVFYYCHGHSPPLLAVPHTRSTILTVSLTYDFSGPLVVPRRGDDITDYTINPIASLSKSAKVIFCRRTPPLSNLMVLRPITTNPGNFFAPFGWKDSSQDKYSYGILKGVAASAEGHVVLPDVILYVFKLCYV